MNPSLPPPSYVFEISVDGTARFPFVSTECAEVYGLSAQAAMDDPHLMHDAVHPDHRDDFDRAVARSRSDIAPMFWEGQLVRTDGSVREVAVAARPHLRLDGAVVWDGIVIDRTGRPEAGSATPTATDDPRPLVTGQEGQAGSCRSGGNHDVDVVLASVLRDAEDALRAFEAAAPGVAADSGLRDLLRRVVGNAQHLQDLRHDALFAETAGRPTTVTPAVEPGPHPTDGPSGCGSCVHHAVTPVASRAP